MARRPIINPIEASFCLGRRKNNPKKNIPNNPPVAFDVHARWPDLGVEQEARITEQKLPALQEFMKYNMFAVSYTHLTLPTSDLV